MKKLFLLLFLLTTLVMAETKQSLFYINNGKVVKLGLANNTKDLGNGYFQNGGKYYKNGVEISSNVYNKETSKKRLEHNLFEDDKYYYIDDKKIEKRAGMKLFSGMSEGRIDEYYSFLLLNDNELSLNVEIQVKVDNIDLKSLNQIGGRYFNDQNGIYYFNNSDFEKLDNVDNKSFEVISETYAKDNKNVYENGKILKNVDLKSFGVIKVNREMEPPVLPLGYDKDGIYFLGTKISKIKLTGKVEKSDGMDFRDSKNNYIFVVNLKKGKAEIRVMNAPRDSSYVGGLIHEDNKYVYTLESKIMKSKDFKWLTNNDMYINNGKVHFISAFFGDEEMVFDTDTFKVLYESKDSLTKIMRDKNGFYKYDGDYSPIAFKKTAEIPEYLIMDKGENKNNNFYFNPINGKYYYILLDSTEKMYELSTIKEISETFDGGYFIGR